MSATITPPFQTIKQAVRSTGLSEHYLRDGIKRGEIPHLRSGTKYLVNVPALLSRLDELSKIGGAVNE